MNISSSTPYTPLEALFLFQLLSRYGFVNNSFSRISEELKSTPLILEQDGYSSPRLSPDALQELAHNLLRDEQRREAEATDRNGGGLSPNSKKRKLATPPLPSLKEAQEQPEKLPILVDRLYAQFREQIIHQIREDEQKIEALQRDIREIERGERDERIDQSQKSLSAQNGAPAAALDTKPLQTPNGQVVPTAVSVPKPVTHKVQDAVRRPDQTPIPQAQAERKAVQPIQPSPSPIPHASRTPSEVRQTPTIYKAQESVRQQPNGTTPVLQHPQTVQGLTVRPTSATPQPPVTEGLQRPEGLSSSRSPAPAQANRQQSPSLKWEPPYQPQQPPQQPPYQQTPIPSPRPPYNATSASIRHPAYPTSAPSSRPQTPQAYAASRINAAQLDQQPRFPGQGTGPSSPSVLLPPQNVGQIPPSLQSLPANATPDGSGHSVPSRRPPSVPLASPQGPSLATGTYAPQHNQAQPVQTPVRPPTGLTAARPAGTPSKPPVPAAQRPQTVSSARPSYSQQVSLPSTPLPQPQLSQTTPKSQSLPHNQQVQSTGPPGLSQRTQAAPVYTPVALPLSARQPSSIQQAQTPLSLSVSPHVVRGYGTRWTNAPTPATPRLEEMTGYFDPQSPTFEPLSPPPQAAETLQSPSKPSETTKLDKDSEKVDNTVTKPRGRQPRSAKKDAPTTQAEEIPTNLDVPERAIKNEETTPQVFEEAVDTNADGSAYSRLEGEPIRMSTKRKRQDSPVTQGPSMPATHVLWTRSFNKISMTALDHIIGHRHANMFAHPVKAREAPGYTENVLRPQDLKGIQKAVTAGSKAAAAAVATMSDVDSNAPAVWLPMSVDLVPPRGIINITQLERELVHMFANAIMYNPDPQRGLGPSFLKSHQGASEGDMEEARGYEFDENGVVKDTRNMFAEVEKLLGDLRNEVGSRAQRPAGATNSRSMSAAGGEAGMAEDDGGEQAGDAKRRRIRG